MTGEGGLRFQTPSDSPPRRTQAAPEEEITLRKKVPGRGLWRRRVAGVSDRGRHAVRERDQLDSERRRGRSGCF